MGGSGGGGGSAGAVSWPSDVQTRYNSLLGSFGGASATSALAYAVAANPFPGRVHSPTNHMNEMSSAIETFRGFLHGSDPSATWAQSVSDAAVRYNQAFGTGFNMVRPNPEGQQRIFDIWTLVERVLNASDWIFDVWTLVEPAMVAEREIFDIWTLVESALVAVDQILDMWEPVDLLLTAPVDISDSWVDPNATFDAPNDIKVDVAAFDQILAATTAHGDVLDDQISSNVQPRFEAGMRDINAVQSSAFAIGRAIIEGMRDRDISKFAADLQFKAFLQRDEMLGQAHMQIDKLNGSNLELYNRAISGSYLDKMKILAEESLTTNKLRAQAILDRQKILADEVVTVNKLRAQAVMDKQKILAEEVLTGNKLRSQALIDKMKILAEEVNVGNKLRSQALIQADKINADSDKAESLINAEMSRHQTALIFQDNTSYYQTVNSQLDLWKAWAGFIVDSERIKYVMQKEEVDKDLQNEAMNARWDLDMVQIAGNLIASISGGTSYTPGPTGAQNALGGAFAGAAIGARVNGSSGYGAGAGAILGGIGAYLLGGN